MAPEDRVSGRHPDLVVGRRCTVSGLYVAHWEFTRFAITSRSRWRLWPQQVLCQLEAAPGLPASPLEVAGVSRPAQWRSSPGLKFRVTAEVTPLEEGSFGHLGALRWRLRVEQWLDVRPIHSQLAQGAR